MTAILGFGACANLVLMEIASDWGVPGIVFLAPLLLCVLGMAASAGVARSRR